MALVSRWLVFVGLLLTASECKAQDVGHVQVVTELSPPHQTMVAGQIGGYSTQLVKAILQQAGVSASIEMYPWARAYKMALQQPDTLIYNMARTAQREQLFQWIGPVASYRLGFVKLAHRQDIQLKALADARRYSIAVQRHDVAENFLKKNGFGQPGQLVLAADISESWQLLLHGKVDLIIDDPMALTAMAGHFNVEPEYVEFAFAIAPLQQQTYLAANKAMSAQLIDALQQAHKQVAESALYQQVMRSAFDEIMPTKQ
ncbi:amino acid ABC transporter substrate-binding protein, PAAT family [Arsukibacterium tuosuense]|uniref:Amino acid ABC transporter substrate-binding protein, PAAT family n=1 Tax=Arsukibacterium tuosuense TaxID=1323745 RepID=A0A285J651_9GAMM|nr:transporter substrate-binding domain-containing protein [Arsukibacterium tuosuense]SNY55698.1 amino acid ABC transporter substrate-binding protein, PAAT family [Arsukibacterium tuosuense]